MNRYQTVLEQFERTLIKDLNIFTFKCFLLFNFEQEIIICIQIRIRLKI